MSVIETPAICTTFPELCFGLSVPLPRHGPAKRFVSAVVVAFFVLRFLWFSARMVPPVVGQLNGREIFMLWLPLRGTLPPGGPQASRRGILFSVTSPA